MPDLVFISYARRSGQVYAEALYTELRRHGISAFLDSADIEHGATFPQALTDALLDARLFILFADATYFTIEPCVI
jgi:hypothetical protein